MRVELVVSDRGDVANEGLRGRVVMDGGARGAVSAADQLVVVEELQGDDADRVVDELFRIARDNAAIARRVMRHHLASRAD